MDLTNFTPNYSGYKLLSEYLMAALHKEFNKSDLINTPESEWSSQRLDLNDGQCITLSKWEGETKKNGSKTKKPFVIYLGDRFLQLDVSNIAFINNRFTWHLKKPTKGSSRDFLESRYGSAVNVSDEYRGAIKKAKDQLNIDEHLMASGYYFLNDITLPELASQFCHFVKKILEWQFEENNSPEEIPISIEIENTDMSEYKESLVRIRQYQGPFKRGLLDRYNGKCIVTECKIKSILIAAHIQDHSVCGNNNLTNGLLLRTDIHTLYDAGLLRISINKESPSDSLLVTLNEEIQDSVHYTPFHNKVIKFSDPEIMPSEEFLMWKYSKHVN